MSLNRRTFIGGASGAFLTAGIGAQFPSRVWARTTLALGSFQIDTLSDGHLALPFNAIFGALPQDELSAILQTHGVQEGPTLTPDCNVTLLRDGERTVLFDAGSGPEFMETAGRLPEALDQIGLDPSEVTHVVFTHAHPDHLWGLLDDFEDPVFSNATYMIGQTEWDYWISPNTVDTIGAARASFAVGARRRLQFIKDQIEFFRDGDEILPGVAAKATFGHTPGHMAFELRQGTESVMVVGDCIGNHHVAFERPDWISGMDQDTDQAAQTRIGLLDQLAAEKTQLIGYHLPYPGIGFAEKHGSGYRFVAQS